MKNLKKVLALALTFALSLSLFAGAAFTDQDEIGKDYVDDVNMLVEIGVINGFEDGSFRPQENITRAQFAKMAYTLKYGYDDQGKLFAGSASKFTDVEGVANLTWAKGYINYCATQNIVGGIGNNKFDPNGNVTVAQASKMLLVILGCDATKEGFGGSNWTGNVVSKAMELGVFDGWVGDPNQAATRELVAKLMRNTVFAPTYIYNPITGVGSQVSALDPSIKNETLGEKTMGMKHVKGLVVSNERFYITKDEEGENLAVSGVGVQNKGKSQVYYQATKSDNKYILTIDRELDDTAIGTMVDVYFKADGNEGNYSNVKVIGNVITNADTVVYEVNAGDIEFMPDGKSNNQRQVSPYISFIADGAEHKIEQRSNTTHIKVANNIDYSGEVFADRFFFADDTKLNVEAKGILENPTFDAATQKWTTYTEFINNIGKDNIQSYRVVSVDGGDSFSYIFRTNKKEMATVTNYSEDRGTVSVSKVGTKDFDEVIIYGEIAKGDDVAVYRENGKIAIAKAENITGKADIKADNVAAIGDVEYRGDESLLKYEIGEYFRKHNLSNNENTKYTVFDGYIVKIDSSAVVGKVEDYAVVISSSYDEAMGSAKVKLALTNETEVVYEVGKVDGKDDNNRNFIRNGEVGKLYRYSVSSGVVNLYTDDNRINQIKSAQSITNKSLVIAADQSYTYDSASTIFLLYGGKEDASNPGTYSPVKALVYKLADMPDVTLGKIAYVTSGSTAVDAGPFASYVINDDSAMPTLVAGAVTISKDKPIVTPITDTVAYLVEAKYQYNFNTDKWYAKVKMIGEKGLIDTITEDEIDTKIGETPSKNGQQPKNFDHGAIVEYKINSENILSSVAVDRGSVANMKKVPASASPADGFYYANIADVRGELIGLYPYSTTPITTVDGKLPAASRVYTLADDYKVIAIEDDEFFEDGGIETVSDSMDIAANQFNAIIQIRSGKVEKVFSIHNNY